MAEMKNLKEVGKRVKEAVKDKEKIILFGDADLDGVTSAIMLQETIEFLGGDSVKVFISDRDNWGYGISKEAVFSLKEEAPALIIALDCGISNFEGAKEAKKAGFDFVIVDHHKTFSELPEASLILDPMQEGDEYPFKKMANGGIVYKLVKEILGESFQEKEDRVLELATLATLADMVPRKEDNKEILDRGLPKLLEKPSLMPLQVLKEKIGEDDFLEKTISLLNITKLKGRVNLSYLFLTSSTKKEAEDVLEELEEGNQERKKQIEEEERKIKKKIKNEEEVVFEEGNFPAPLAGTLASRVIRKCKKPVFLYTIEEGVVRGSVRVPSGEDAVEAMSHCRQHIETFGGHPEAAGFMLAEKNLENFKQCILDYFQERGDN